MTQSETHARLTDVIERLCNPHDTVVEHLGVVVNIRRDPPLLDALRAGIGGNIKSGGGGSLSHSERNLIDATATELYASIQDRVRRWARAADIQPDRLGWPPTCKLLHTWHAHVFGWAPDQLDPYVTRLEGWAREISDLVIDPPDKWSPTDSQGKFRTCPKCGERWAVIDYGGEHERVPAIKIIERNPLEQSVALCQACGATWKGLLALRELSASLVTTAIPVQDAT